MAAQASTSTSSAALELRVGGKYRLGRKIGSGSFGDIYLGAFVVEIDRLESQHTHSQSLTHTRRQYHHRRGGGDQIRTVEDKTSASEKEEERRRRFFLL
jgi:hypothetical protein